jgi:hypothetical protein
MADSEMVHWRMARPDMDALRAQAKAEDRPVSYVARRHIKQGTAKYLRSRGLHPVLLDGYQDEPGDGE